MRALRTFLSTLLLVAGCGAPPSAPDGPLVDAARAPLDASTALPDAGAPPPDMSSAPCPAMAGTFTLFAIPPPAPLDWSTPNRLFNSTLTSTNMGNSLVSSGMVVKAHSIGHVNLKLDCGAASIPLTGQTGGGEDWMAAGDGFGIVWRDTPGSLDEFGQDHVDTVNDIALREQNGLVTLITFQVNADVCQRIRDFYDAYQAHNAQSHYSGMFRPRRFEGAGCGIFGAGVVDVAGLLRRSLFTPPWSRSVIVGSARFSDFLGKGYYVYGSNLVAPDGNGGYLIWPRGVNVPASNTVPNVLEGTTLDSWTGPQDTDFGLPQLPPTLSNRVPFTIYDPEMMVDWAEQVYLQARANGSASALGMTWTPSAAGMAHEIVTDATCLAPQTLAFDADNDNLFLDSDAP
jgi:hypothetical protein